jgi:hypothetical protein
MTSTIKDIEETLIIVKDLLSTNLQAYLTTINTEKADGRTLTAPQSDNYTINEMLSFPEFPFIEIIGNTSDTVVAGLAGGINDEVDHNIVIKVHNITPEGSSYDAAVRSYRFTRAIREIILDNRTISDQVIGIKINNVNYAPMVTDGTTFKSEVWINCTVKHHCTFS